MRIAGMNTIAERICVAAVGAALMAGCTFVQPTAEGEKVRVLAAHEIEHCRNLGALTSTVTDRVGVILRSREAVADDVLQNAKNGAADMGGDTLVPTSIVENGKQTFSVYRCLTP